MGHDPDRPGHRRAIATAASVSTAIWVGAIGAFFAVLPVLLSPVRGLRDMPTPLDDGSAGVAGAPEASAS